MKALVSLSGGMDSTTALAMAIQDYGSENVSAVFTHYGSKHNDWEENAVIRVAGHYGVRLRFVDLSGIFSNSNLLKSGGDIPEGHYEAESMRKTVVPGRNLVIASVLASVAESQGYGKLILGVHAGDHHIYPDCRPLFVNSLIQVVSASTEGAVMVEAPFLHVTKVGILRIGLELNVPYHLTRTCYTDKMIACGKCGSCQERLESFALLGKDDPLDYHSRKLMPK